MKRLLSIAVWGLSWKTGTKFKGAAKTLRGLAKSVQYASQYAATVETVHKVITQTEIDHGDGTTELPYLSLSLREVRVMHEKWCEEAQFDVGWEQELERFRKFHYLDEPIHGRRRDFLDGENPNEIVNFPIQSSGAALMNNAIIELAKRIPMHKWGPGQELSISAMTRLWWSVQKRLLHGSRNR